MSNDEMIFDWIKFACRTCDVPDLSDYISVRWSSLFTARLADANGIKKQIRLSVPLWPRIDEAEQRNTIIDETCHIIDYQTGNIYGKPHGKTWKNFMLRCGEEPKLYGNIDTKDLTRKYARIDMYCSCRTHSISKRRHTRVMRGEIRIICNHCHETLRLTPIQTPAS